VVAVATTALSPKDISKEKGDERVPHHEVREEEALGVQVAEGDSRAPRNLGARLIYPSCSRAAGRCPPSGTVLVLVCHSRFMAAFRSSVTSSL